MFEVCFLGTMAAGPTSERALTSTLVMHGGRKFLVDCGEGVQQRLLQSGRGFAGLSHVFLTHGHLDHYIGLAGLVLALDNFGFKGPLEVFADPHTTRLVSKLLSLCELRGNVSIKQREVREGVLFQDEHLRVTATRLAHAVPSYAFVFEEQPRRKLLLDAADRLGVPQTDRGKLVRGETVVLPDGTSVAPDEVLGEPAPPCKLVYIGDTGFHDDLLTICEGATCLICEATYLERNRDLADRYKHLTASQAATLAVNAHVSALVVNHFSNRYDISEIVEEVHDVLPDAIVPNDLDFVRVTSSGVQGPSP